jgi:hypothetical protein
MSSTPATKCALIAGSGIPSSVKYSEMISNQRGLAAVSRSRSQSQVPANARLVASGCAFAITFDSADFALSRDAIIDWLAQCARTVSDYLGAFPVPQARLRVSPSEGGRALGRGTSWGGPIARCRIAVRRDATREELDRDWVLTHELFHFAFPSVPEANRRMEEGVSTYVEPIARQGGCDPAGASLG